ncbi:MAG: glycosyltransferase family 2 protein [Clostridiales bacterium]|nr:glycosyltransferase family 2 protein [Clostridiales bacterium]
MPKITFVLPIYGVEKYLQKAIDSLKAQTFSDWEAVLVDDGSKDNCGKICDAAASEDKRFKVIHKKNGGLGPARNSGLEAATGEYINFFDPDDYIEPDYAEVMLGAAEENNADIVYCGMYEETQDRHGNTSVAVIKSPINGVYRDDPCRRVFPEIASSFLIFTKVFKRSIIGDKRFPAVLMGEDGMFLFNVYENDPACIVGVNKPLYHYIHRAGSISGSYHPERVDDNFYLSNEAKKLIDVWGVNDDKMFINELRYLKIRDLMIGVKNIALSPYSFARKVKWLRDIVKTNDVEDAIGNIPTDRFNSRNDKIKMFTLKKKLYSITILLAVMNQMKAKLLK